MGKAEIAHQLVKSLESMVSWQSTHTAYTKFSRKGCDIIVYLMFDTG